MAGSFNRYFDTLYGNDNLKALFSDALECGHVSHAYILEGPNGSGKSTLVLSLLSAMADDGAQAKKIREGLCPDVFIIDLPEDRQSIGVDAARSIKESAFIKPNDLEFKAYIIKNADKMTEQAQNALLKILEEPPKNVYFFLLSGSAASLLSTVRSRATLLRMQIFSPTELTDYIAKNAPRHLQALEKDPDLVLSAGGSIGALLSLLEQGGGGDKNLHAIAAELILSLGSRRAEGALDALDLLGNKVTRAQMSAFADLVLLGVRDLLACKYASCEDRLSPYFSKIKESAESFSASSLLKTERLFSKLHTRLSAGCNMSLAKTMLVSGIQTIFFS